MPLVQTSGLQGGRATIRRIQLIDITSSADDDYCFDDIVESI